MGVLFVRCTSANIASVILHLPMTTQRSLRASAAMSIDAQEWKSSVYTKQSYQIEKVSEIHSFCIIRAFAMPANTPAKKIMHLKG